MVGWRLLIKIASMVVRRVLDLAVLVMRRDLTMDAELLVFPHENAVGRRHAGRIRYGSADRVRFTALAQLIPRRRWAGVLPVTPATPGTAFRRVPDRLADPLHQGRVQARRHGVAAPYYRCRFPSEYALANHVRHPLNVTLRQETPLDPLDEWLASKFGPGYLPGTIDELAAAIRPPEIDAGAAEIDAQIAGCDRKRAQYRAQCRHTPSGAGSNEPGRDRLTRECLVRRAGCAPQRRPRRQGPDLRWARPAPHLPARQAARPDRGPRQPCSASANRKGCSSSQVSRPVRRQACIAPG